MAMKPTLQTVHHWAVELGTSYRTVQGWLAGRAPDDRRKRGAGEQELWLLKSVIEAGFSNRVSGNAEFLDPDQQRARRDRAAAEKLEIEVAVRRGEVAPLADIEAEWADMIASARGKLLALPAKLGPVLADLTDPVAIAERIRIEGYSALAELAKDPPERGAPT